MADLVRSVTVLAYHFWEDEGYEDAFLKVAHAFQETWRHCGLLESVVVVNKVLPCVRDFAAQHANLKIQVEPRLLPGQLETMSEDCDSRLHERFQTPYVLVIQADGYPLRSGLEEFLGRWDYIGAPYVRISWWRCLICRMLGYWMSNGGFSLRSRRLCEYAAAQWKRRYAKRHPSECTIDDLYYTRTLPMGNPFFRFRYRVAPATVAIRFSYDALVSQKLREMPFGFHRDVTLGELTRNLV